MRLLWSIYLMQSLLILTALFNVFLYRTAPTVADAVFTLRETAIAAKEYWADVLNHAVYRTLEENFPDGYGDDPEEQWNVPPWFVDPQGPGVVSCNGIGCTVWNLTDAGDPQYANNPCPDVVSATSMPDPRQELQNINDAEVLDNARDDANTAAHNLTDALRGGTWGNVYITPTSVNISSTPSGIRVVGDAQIDINIPASVSIGYTATQEFNTEINVEYAKGEAICECKNKNTGLYETLAKYDVNRALYHFITRDSNTGDIVTDRTMLYVQWFLTRTFASSVNPSNYEECRMVVP